ncbi:GntR family transcriptional regulator [Telmatobacter bradus]|uniref:GntR family transcriptional regulator n=1 Tax=Telmatobacter bradus TaxID=474953 RepID=UPI003B430FBA
MTPMKANHEMDGPNLETPAKPALAFHPIDKNSIVGLAEQIQAQLLGMVHSGQLAMGDPLPSEVELGQLFGVNRTVGRKALLQIEALGYAVRMKGHGTFVTQPKIARLINGITGFSAEMQALGIVPGARVLAAERREATAEVALRLGIFRGTPVFRLRRLRLANNSPVAIEESFLNLARFPGIQKMDFNDQSLYAVLADHYGVKFSRTDSMIESIAAGRREARLLNLAPRACLLVMTRTVYGADGRPVEMACTQYRGDRVRAVLGQPPATTIDEAVARAPHEDEPETPRWAQRPRKM